MTFNQFWDALTKRNPPLADAETKMTITSASFRKSMQQAFEQGYEQRATEAKRAGDLGSIFGSR